MYYAARTLWWSVTWSDSYLSRFSNYHVSHKLFFTKKLAKSKRFRATTRNTRAIVLTAIFPPWWLGLSVRIFKRLSECNYSRKKLEIKKEDLQTLQREKAKISSKRLKTLVEHKLGVLKPTQFRNDVLIFIDLLKNFEDELEEITGTEKPVKLR
jgi:hypothetical protein